MNLRLVCADSLQRSAYKKLKAQVYIASSVSPSLRGSLVQKLTAHSTQGVAAGSSLGASSTAAALADVHSSAWKRVLGAATPRLDRGESDNTALGVSLSIFLQRTDIICIQLVDVGGTSLGWAVLLPEWLLAEGSPCAGAWGATPSTPPASYVGTSAGADSAALLQLPLGAPPGQPSPSGTLSLSGSIAWAPASSMKRSSLANTVKRSTGAEQSTTPGTAAAPTTPTARVVVLPHWHTKWCDRKRQVCVASGAVRELNRLGVIVAGVPSSVTPAEVKFEWLRSSGAAAEGGAAAAGEGAFVHEDTGMEFVPCSGVPPPGKASSEHWPLGASRPPLDAFAVFDIPPAPPLLQPAAKVAKAQELAQETAAVRSRPGQSARVNASMTVQWPAAAVSAAPQLQGVGADTLRGATRRGYGVPPPEAVLHDSPSALGLLQAELTEVAGDPSVHFLRADDVGHFFLARVSWPGCGSVMSQAVGPVEAVPPAAREVWIDGTPAVGQVLTAQAYYAGGIPGACSVEWIVVSEEGERTTHDAAVVDFVRPAPDTDSCPEASGPHGRLFRVGSEHIGSIFKVSVNPVRADGVEGAPATSRPSKEVPAEQ